MSKDKKTWDPGGPGRPGGPGFPGGPFGEALYFTDTYLPSL